MNEIDALGRDQVGERARVARRGERIGAFGDEPHPFAAEALQFAVERAVFGGDDDTRAGAQQRDRGIDRRARRRRLGQRGQDLQHGRAGQAAHARASAPGLRSTPCRLPMRVPAAISPCVPPRDCGETHTRMAALGAQRSVTVHSPSARHAYPPVAVAPGGRRDRFMSHSSPNFLKLGTRFRRTVNRGPARRSGTGARPGLFWLGGFKSDMKGTKAEALSALGARKRPRLRALRLFRPWRIRAAISRAGTIGRWLEESLAVFDGACAGPAGGGRLLDGRLDRAVAGARTAPPQGGGQGRGAGHRRAGADRAGGRFHRGADVAALPAKIREARSREGRLACARPTTASPIRSRAA